MELSLVDRDEVRMRRVFHEHQPQLVSNLSAGTVVAVAAVALAAFGLAVFVAAKLADGPVILLKYNTPRKAAHG